MAMRIQANILKRDNGEKQLIPRWDFLLSPLSSPLWIDSFHWVRLSSIFFESTVLSSYLNNNLHSLSSELSQSHIKNTQITNESCISEILYKKTSIIKKISVDIS